MVLIKVLLVWSSSTLDSMIPIGLSLLSACLKRAGHKVKLFDTTFYNIYSGDELREEHLEVIPTNLEDVGISRIETDVYEDFRMMVDQFQPDLIGVSCIEPSYPEGLTMLKSLGDTDIPRIIGGMHISNFGDEILQEDCVDMICRGEGELAIVELADRIGSNKDYSNVRNLWVKVNGKIIKNPLRPLINLNDLPVQDWEIFDKKRSLKSYLGKIRITAGIETMRGCAGLCSFCNDPSLKRLYSGLGSYVRYKSTEKVIEEILFLKEKYNLQFIKMVDADFFGRSIDELKRLANAYKTVKIPFWAESRAITTTREKVKLLEEMGCEGFAIGVESGNSYIRNKILKKGVSEKKILEAFSFFRNTKIKITVNNIIGNPFEGRKEIFDTIELNRKINEIVPIRCRVSTLHPYGGTEIKEICIKEGWMSPNYSIKISREGFILNTSYITKEEIKGLHRTFVMYTKFPKSMWSQIKIAEKNDVVYEELKEEYKRKFM